MEVEHPGESQKPLEIAQNSKVVINSKSARRRRTITFFVVTAINVGLIALLWTQLLSPAKPATTTTTSSTDGLGDISSPLIGQPAPDFSLQSVTGTQGTKVSLADFKGKAVILNFWDSACGPCNDEAPFLQKSWQQRLQGMGVVFIGVDGPERSINDARSFLSKYQITYRNVIDTIDGATGINYGVTGHPETVFINKEGKIAAKWIAPLTEKGLEAELAKLTT
jgi:cytochrome c biogenesis protein CcmG, thiol:disulfide interchange protein DsbE